MQTWLVLLLSVGVTMAGGLLGGYKRHEDHNNDAGVQAAAKFAVEKLGEERKEKLDLIKIVSAHTQVVAGTNYKLLLDVAGASNKLEHVEATVYVPLGKQEMQLTGHRTPKPDEFEQTQEAVSESRSGGLLGAFKEVPSSDEEVQEAARFAAEQLGSRSNSLFPLELKQVVQAKTKVANGRVFDMAIKLSQGDLPDQIMQVEVTRDLKNNFVLVHSAPASK